MPGLLYTDDLVLCGELDEDLREMVGWLAEVCRRRGPKVGAGKSKVMALNREEGLECEVHVDRIYLDHVSEFKYMRYVLDEYGTDGAECSRKVASAIRSLVNTRDLQLECAKVLHETLLAPVLIHGSEMLWKEKERSRIRVLQMDNLRGFLVIRRMDRFLTAQIRELCGVKKG